MSGASPPSPSRLSLPWESRNPVTGCTYVSAGCRHCYAERFAERWRGVAGHHYEHGFDLQLRPERLELPLRWKKPRQVFVDSMSDPFHESIPDDYVREVFAVMERAPRHVYLVLTKREGRLTALAPHTPWPPQVWMGVTVERHEYRGGRMCCARSPPPCVTSRPSRCWGRSTTST